MTAADLSPGALAGELFRFQIHPFSQLLQLEGDRWEATGDDPQFLLGLPAPVTGPGIYRITATLAGDTIARPCLYLDLGEGWSETTCYRMEHAGEGRWTVLASLPGVSGAVRFDPTEHAGHFHLGGITLERLGTSEAALLLLSREAAACPEVASTMLHEASRIAATWGVHAASEWLLAGGAETLRQPATAYESWVAKHDTLAAEDLRALRVAVGQLPRRPLLSLLLPVDGLPSDRLRASVDAVLAQTYPDWELCLVFDEAPASPTLRGLVDAYCTGSSRIRRVAVPAGAGTTRYNDAIASLQGEYVAFLTAAQVLPPHALMAFADAVVRHPEARIVYADSDGIDGDGRRSDPWFRPDWNPDLFLSQDYICDTALLQLALVREIGGFREAFSADPIADLMLRTIAHCEIPPMHLPLVLSHRPTGAVAASDSATRRLALREQLEVAHPGVKVDAVEAGSRIRWSLPEPVPMVSLIVPTRDRLDLLKRCIDSILSLTTYPSFEVVIVDNQSSEPSTLEYFRGLASEPRVRVLPHDAPFNYSEINNFAVVEAVGEIVGLVNNDIEVLTPDWLEEMVSHAVRPGIGAVGAMLYYPDDTIQHAGVILGLGGVAGHVYSRQPRGTLGQHGRAALVQDLSAVTAACLLVRKSVYLEVGGLNERLTVAFNDVDFCLRLLEHGYRNVWTPFAEFYHHESASRGSEDTPGKLARFRSEVDYMVETWRDQLAEDPAYSPNLSLQYGNAHVLADPPRRPLRDWLAAVTRKPRRCNDDRGTGNRPGASSSKDIA